MMDVSILERDVTKKETVDQKIVDQLKFEEEDQSGQETDLVIDGIVVVDKALNDQPCVFYYLIH